MKHGGTATISVGASGVAPSSIAVDGPWGMVRSRDGSVLEAVSADAEFWNRHFASHSDDQGFHILLIDPSRDEVLSSAAAADRYLAQKRGGHYAGEFHFAFSGHGTSDGELVLHDGVVSAVEIIDAATAGVEGASKRWIGMSLDCCHAARALAELLVYSRICERFSLRDAFAASLHDEFAYEWPDLRHGVYTYTMANPGGPIPTDFPGGNIHDAAPLTDNTQERIEWQHLRSDPVAYLTNGEQHVLDVMNSHILSVRGAGEASLADLDHDVTDVQEILDIIEKLRDGR